jgi:pyrroline-5-carboxylate reductase
MRGNSFSAFFRFSSFSNPTGPGLQNRKNFNPVPIYPPADKSINLAKDKKSSMIKAHGSRVNIKNLNQNYQPQLYDSLFRSAFPDIRLVEPRDRAGYTRRMLLRNAKIALIGAGNMAEALVSGMLKARLTDPKNIHATDVDPSRLERFYSLYNIRGDSNNLAATQSADIIILAIKPQAMDEVLEEIKSVAASPRLFITVAAGYPIARVLSHLNPQAAVIRAMPNTPAIILEGVTALATGPGVSSDQNQMAIDIFEAVGRTVQIEEGLLDAVTGLSGSGPAYVYVMIEALADGGVRMGIPRQVAQTLAAQTLMGTAKMVLEMGDHPGALKDRVASPGGTTIAGLHKLEQGRLRATLMNAVEAATRRSQELGG